MPRFVSILLLFITPLTFAASPVVEMSVSKKVVRMGDAFELRVRTEWLDGDCGGGNIDLNAFINGGSVSMRSSTGTSDPEVVGMEKFTQQGSSQSTNCEIVNGKVSERSERVYTLTPLSVGTFSLSLSGTVANGSGTSVTIEVQTGSISSVPSSSVVLPVPMGDTPSPSDPVIAPNSNDTNTIDPFWLRVGLVVILFLVAGAFAWRYLGSLDADEKIDFSESEKSVWWAPSPISTFASIDAVERSLREYYADRTGQSTDSLTYAELADLEPRPDARAILWDILTELTRARYAGEEGNFEDLVQRLRLIIQKQ